MDVDIVAGYLGAGKTTCIIEMLAAAPDPSTLVVLVNEFGDVGIDSALIGDSTEVVELASGCICCTLRLDFRQQIVDIADRWHPRRLLIEPTGVATIAQVVRALGHTDLRRRVKGVRVFVLVDAVSFAEHLRDSPQFFGSQVSQADVLLLNKIDLVSPARGVALRAALESMNPSATIVATVFGRLPEGLALPSPEPLDEHTPDAEVLEGLTSMSFEVGRSVSREAVRALFGRLAGGELGRVERAKAIVETDDGWVRFDIASGLVDERAWSPAPDGRLVVIGSGISESALIEAVGPLNGRLV